MVKVINIISKNVRFPYEYIKGSEKQRFFKAQEAANDLFEKMQKKYGDVWTLQDIREEIDNLPYKIKCKVVKEDKKGYMGNLKEIVSVEFKKFMETKKLNEQNKKSIIPYLEVSLNGFELKLRTDKSNSINKFTAIHEIRHLFDRLYSPKFCVMRRNTLAASTDEQYNAWDKIRDLLFDFNKEISMKKIKNEVKNNLQIISDDKRIDILQGFRNKLKSEKNAYHQEMGAYMENHEFIKMIDCFLYIHDNAKLNSKIRFLNKLIKNYIKTERNA